MRLEHKTLGQFWNEENAPPGFVYYDNGKPYIQLHFFNNCFILFFHIKPEIQNIIRDVIRVKQNLGKYLSEIESNNHPRLFIKYLSKKPYKATVKVLKFVSGSVAKYILVNKEITSYNLHEINKTISDINIPSLNIVSVAIELKAVYDDTENGVLEIHSWEDMSPSDLEEKEKGFTIYFDNFNKQQGLISDHIKALGSNLFLDNWSEIYDIIEDINAYYLGKKNNA